MKWPWQREQRKVRKLPDEVENVFTYTDDRRLFFRAGDGSRWEVHPNVTMRMRGRGVTMDTDHVDLIEEGPEIP